MNASELNRKLLYCGYDDISAYLRNSTMNRFVYNLIIDYAPEKLETPMLTIFNEIYYQCVRVNYDDNPGVDLKARYLDEETKWLGSLDSALLVFSVVWALLRRKHDTTFHEQCFVEQFYPLLEGGKYEFLALVLIKKAAGERLLPPKKVHTMPCAVNDINADKEAWREVTNNYSWKCIEKYIMLYPAIEEQRCLFDMIIKAAEGVVDTSGRFFTHLHDSIEDGDYLPDNSMSNDADYDEVKELSYKEEYEKIKEKYDEQEERHKREVEFLNYLHQSEIDEFRKKLEFKLLKRKRSEDPNVLLFSFSEMVEVVKARFSKTAADEFSNMLYTLATKHGYLDEEISETIDGIVLAVLSRDTQHQSFNFNNTVHQININSEVENKHEEK